MVEKKQEKEGQKQQANKTKDSGSGRKPSFRRREEEETIWIPKTKIGKAVQDGEITDIGVILDSGTPIMEVEIVDTLLPNLEEEILDVRRVQRTLDSGRRTRFSVMAAVGDKNGHVGLGLVKGVEAGPTIRKSIARAKLNIIEVKRGCGSWECGCMQPHTVPFKISGKGGSVKIVLKPAPRGLGIVASDNSQKILGLAGITDVWTKTEGQTRTIINQSLALYDALKKLNRFKSSEEEDKKLAIEKK